MLTIPFNYEPRNYQVGIFKHGDSDIKRFVTVWHRRAGKDKTMLNFTIKKMFERIGVYYYFFPTFAQGRKILWDGIDRDGFKFTNHFPPQLIVNYNNSEMKITLRVNKEGDCSIFQIIGTDNYDSIMGTNPIGCVFSEYSLQNPSVWDFIRPILSENGGWALFNYTPRGKNHGWMLYEMAKNNPKWFCQLLTVDMTRRTDGTPVISSEAIQEERESGMAEEMIEQEYYCSFDAGNQGAYYNEQFKKIDREKRILSVPYDPELPVETFWDLGVGDSNAIWFIQRLADEFRVIDFYEHNNVGLNHYIPFVLSIPYWYKEHWAPHDIQNREYTTGMARYESAKNMMADLRRENPEKVVNGVKFKDIKETGIDFRIVPNISIDDGIDAVRRVLNKCFFNNAKQSRKSGEGLRGVGYGIDALRSYHKEYDEKRHVYRNTPHHDWSSHASDAFRYFAVATKPEPTMADAIEAAIKRGDPHFDKTSPLYRRVK